MGIEFQYANRRRTPGDRSGRRKLMADELGEELAGRLFGRKVGEEGAKPTPAASVSGSRTGLTPKARS